MMSILKRIFAASQTASSRSKEKIRLKKNLLHAMTSLGNRFRYWHANAGCAAARQDGAQCYFTERRGVMPQVLVAAHLFWHGWWIGWVPWGLPCCFLAILCSFLEALASSSEAGIIRVFFFREQLCASRPNQAQRIVSQSYFPHELKWSLGI